MSTSSIPYSEAVSCLFAANEVIAMTGAGLSVASGIPDFRSPGGLWERFDPYDYAHIDSFMRDPRRVWTMLDEMNATLAPARPNDGHKALAELERLGRLGAVITQNIDELHQEAGSRDVIEFHGSAKRFTCIHCGRRPDPAPVLAGEYGSPPACPHCGTILKPDIVFFGEGIPPKALERSFALAQSADVMLVVGTSAEVSPANYLPEAMREHGGRVIEVNLSPTRLSRRDVLSLFGPAEEVLPRLVRELKDRLVETA